MINILGLIKCARTRKYSNLSLPRKSAREESSKQLLKCRWCHLGLCDWAWDINMAESLIFPPSLFSLLLYFVVTRIFFPSPIIKNPHFKFFSKRLKEKLWEMDK